MVPSAFLEIPLKSSEMTNGTLTVNDRKHEKPYTMSADEFLAALREEIDSRRR